MIPRSLAAATLAAYFCFGTAGQAEPYANYLCRDGQKLSAIFEKAGSVLVMSGGGALRLSKRGPGSRYASPSGAWRAAGSEAVLSIAGRPATRCRLVERGGR